MAVSLRAANLAFGHEGNPPSSRPDRRPGCGGLASAPRNRRNPPRGDRGRRCNRRLRSVDDRERRRSPLRPLTSTKAAVKTATVTLGARAGRDDARELGRPYRTAPPLVVLVFVSSSLPFGLVVFGGAGRRLRRLVTAPARTSPSRPRHDRRAPDCRPGGDACRPRAAPPRAACLRPGLQPLPGRLGAEPPQPLAGSERFLSARSSGTHFRSRFRPRRRPAASSTRRSGRTLRLAGYDRTFMHVTPSQRTARRGVERACRALRRDRARRRRQNRSPPGRRRARPGRHGQGGRSRPHRRRGGRLAPTRASSSHSEATSPSRASRSKAAGPCASPTTTAAPSTSRGRPSRSPRAGLRPRARRCGGGRQPAASTTTSSTPAPAARPTGPWRTATVAASSCVEANTASTAAIVLGDGALDWLEARNLPARLVDEHGAVFHAGLWPVELAQGGMTLLASSGSAYWFLTRGSGVVTLVLLTASVCLGVLTSVRWRSTRLPRFLVSGLHRNVTLLAVVFLAIHVVTTLLDAYAPIHLQDAFIPFVSAVPADLARPRRPLVRLDRGSRGDEPLAGQARLRNLADDALACLRVMAARARPLAGHGQRRAHELARRCSHSPASAP